MKTNSSAPPSARTLYVIQFFLWVAVFVFELQGQSLKAVAELNLGPLPRAHALKPAICPDGRILSLVPSTRLSILDQNLNLLAQVTDPFPANTLALSCGSDQVLASGSAFWQEFQWVGNRLVAGQKMELTFALQHTLSLPGKKVLAVGVRGKTLSLLQIRLSMGDWAALHTENMDFAPEEMHRRARFEGEFALSWQGNYAFPSLRPGALPSKKSVCRRDRFSKHTGCHFPQF
jgi:hypothetical protein